MAEEPRKRSRFDQTEPRRPSRFDRRSRSPPERKTSDRSRSPLPSRSPPASSAGKLDAAAAAAAAAARINAQLAARKIDTPPAQPVCNVLPLIIRSLLTAARPLLPHESQLQAQL
jgi:hypothetical protein